MGLFDGGPESIVLILIIIVLLFGSEKLPEIARGIGRARIEFEKGKRMFMDEMGEVGFTNKGPENKREYDDKTTKNLNGKSKIFRAAENLGIDTKGRTEEELREAILAEMNRS